MSDEKKPEVPNLLDQLTWPKDLVYDPDKHFITVFLHRTEEDAKAFYEQLTGKKEEDR
jgi:hypothetical protein